MSLTTVRMFPEISPHLENNMQSLQTSHNDNSSSDDGSDICAGDTYLPVEEGEQLPDETYSSEYMEEDGNYGEFLVGI